MPELWRTKLAKLNSMGPEEFQRYQPTILPERQYIVPQMHPDSMTVQLSGTEKASLNLGLYLKLSLGSASLGKILLPFTAYLNCKIQ